MKKKQESEFVRWFEEQHGERPDKRPLYKLEAEADAAERLFWKNQEIRNKCRDYDNRRTSALYAWQAAKREPYAGT